MSKIRSSDANVHANGVYRAAKTGPYVGTQFRCGGCCAPPDTGFYRAIRNIQNESAEIERRNRESPPPLPCNVIVATSYHSVPQPQPTMMSRFFGAFAAARSAIMRK